MESEVSGIAKLGIVLIALAVLIGLGFGIFQISKGTANTGVTNVQGELDSVATSQYTTYDQTNVTGQMVRSSISDFEGENVAVLVATQAWINVQKDASTMPSKTIYDVGTGLKQSYADTGNTVPIVYAFSTSDELKAAAGQSSITSTYLQTASDGDTVVGSFINYNAILGNIESGAAGTTGIQATFKSYASAKPYMAGIYFDSNCFRCTSGFAVDESGRNIFNNITSSIQKTGRTEFIPTGAKFNSYLIRDESNTIFGIVFTQIGG